MMPENTGSGVLLPVPGNHVTLYADRLEYRTFRFSDLESGITRDDHQIDVQVNTVNFCGVDISGRMKSTRHPKQTGGDNLEIHAINRENVGELLSCFIREFI